MHGTSIPSPNVHFPSAASRGCPVTSASTESTISYFSASATTLDNPSGIFPIVSLVSPTTLTAVLLCLFASSYTHFNFSPISGLLRWTWKSLIDKVTVPSFTEAIFNKKFPERNIPLQWMVSTKKIEYCKLWNPSTMYREKI